jgi:hypothetical protein
MATDDQDPVGRTGERWSRFLADRAGPTVSLQVSVTQANIDDGVMCSSSACPVALAIYAAIANTSLAFEGWHRVVVDPPVVMVAAQQGVVRGGRFDDQTCWWVNRYDTRGSGAVDPVEFTLGLHQLYPGRFVTAAGAERFARTFGYPTLPQLEME